MSAPSAQLALHLPSPSYWPLVLAAGMPLVGYGLIFSLWLCLVGGLIVGMLMHDLGIAKAAKIYADSFGKDPQFYDFYRAMQSYRRTFETGEGESAIIMSPDNEYLRRFRGG